MDKKWYRIKFKFKWDIKGPAELFYFVSNKFDPSLPDEKRIKWDALGTDFWAPKRD